MGNPIKFEIESVVNVVVEVVAWVLKLRAWVVEVVTKSGRSVLVRMFR